jgi:hypothetical protein
MVSGWVEWAGRFVESYGFTSSCCRAWEWQWLLLRVVMKTSKDHNTEHSSRNSTAPARMQQPSVSSQRMRRRARSAQLAALI